MYQCRKCNIFLPRSSESDCILTRGFSLFMQRWTSPTQGMRALSDFVHKLCPLQLSSVVWKIVCWNVLCNCMTGQLKFVSCMMPGDWTKTCSWNHEAPWEFTWASQTCIIQVWLCHVVLWKFSLPIICGLVSNSCCFNCFLQQICGNMEEPGALLSFDLWFSKHVLSSGFANCDIYSCYLYASAVWWFAKDWTQWKTGKQAFHFHIMFLVTQMN